MTKRPIKLLVSYDGTDFSGWQRQKNARSVQEELEKALEKMHGDHIRLTGAGRTDAGVHARGQVAGFFTDIASISAEKFALALNRLLPGDIRILSSGDGPEDFHARFDASLRRYRYFMASGPIQDALGRRYAWNIGRRPSISVLNPMAAAFLGEHDFSAFASAKDISASKSRFVAESSFWYEGEGLVYQVAANAFLWRMVRSLVGTLILLESQVSSPEEGIFRLKAILEGGRRETAGPTAPPYGLFLWNVEYGTREHGHPRRPNLGKDLEET
ncbi:MAG: tRNA pseudouridine(38-40) synthase TruA [Spirochaetes bacterium]|nr:tRNA pseudouridine(38-40) synthase TruA [Spirochaetota bacterium]